MHIAPCTKASIVRSPGTAARIPEQKRLAVGIVGLRTDMNGKGRRVFPQNTEHARIGYKNAVRACLFEKSEIRRRFLKIAVMREDVRGHVDPHAGGMRIPDRFRKGCVAEILRGAAQ